ncbi:TlpA family protein disulfide reductase [Paraburkholderia phenoliruptrix]|uniref:Thiol-disulfide oxidoreductase ResA n=2 Tax=Paraburkholderia phenoliruptrix TaxID=252970 RepID=A0A6J5K818_9BURK|nr:TlpA disulfide reductase family protein [Paraburkholderia phenoliruptrix]AFT87160.1 redoxin domain-containing protein [Paraburkholderia phenoliruptrix BR3459a]CAB4049472.1 Thiol-disulfide oxidoreductase ResA [Paraburkholderia phenoliruptrix]
MNLRRILFGAVVAVIAAASGVLAHHWLNGNAHSRSDNDGVSEVAHGAQPASRESAVAQFWAAPVTTADGKPESLTVFKGRPIVVNFWASWCGPCVEEMPALSQLQRDYANKGIQFVGLGVDSEKNVQTFLQKVKVAYPVYVTGFGGADLARAFGNTAGGLPFTVVIDANGNIRSTKLGQIDPKILKQTLDAL